ncbi:MAG: FAD/NAD(P)-binding protein [bacterium]
MTAALDWLIVGGGIHGVHLAARLIGEAGVDPAALAVVDGNPRLLARWRECTANTGMSHLRSAGVHHLDLDPWALKRFTGHRDPAFAPFIAPYNRPALALFDAHCDAVIDRYALAARHRRARVEAIALGDREARVALDDGDTLAARHVILALGLSDQPAWPPFARALRADGAAVEHVFTPGHALADAAPGERIAVIGGGISAAQVALRLARAGRVALVSRHPLRERDFDSDLGWIGPKYLAGFHRIADRDRRRAIIDAQRHRGSVPGEVHRAVRKAIASGAITWRAGEVEAATGGPDAITLRVADAAFEVDRLVLATGFERARPGGAMLDRLVADAGLPCAACGYPIVDAHLRWHPRLFVSGPLAELELGPVARNIVGARHAAARLVERIGRARPRAVALSAPGPRGGPSSREVRP